MQIYQAISNYLPPAWEGPPRLVSCAKNIHRLRGPQQGGVNQALRARIEVIKLLVFSMIEIGIAILITGSVGLVRPEISIICYQKLALLRPKNALIENISTRPWVYLPLAGMTTFLLSNAMKLIGVSINPRAIFGVPILAYSLFVSRLELRPMASAWNGPPSLVARAKNIHLLRGPQQGLFKQSLMSRIEVIKLIAVSLIEIGRRLLAKNFADAAKLGVAIVISGSLGLVRPEISLICYQQLALIRPRRTLGEIAQQVMWMSPVAAAAPAVLLSELSNAIVRPPRYGFPLDRVWPYMLPVMFLVPFREVFEPNPALLPNFLRPAGFDVRISELNENPIAILQQVETHYTKPSTRIYFIEPDDRMSPGADAGGLKRVFYTRLFQSLKAKGIVPSHQFEQIQGNAVNQLNFMSVEDDRVMPFLAVNDNQRAVKMRGFQTVGKLLAWCQLGQFTIGELFSPNLYQMLLSFRTEELINMDEIPDSVRIRLVQVAQSNATAEVRRYFGLLQQDAVSKEEYVELLKLAEDYIEGDMPAHRTALTTLNLAWVKKTILDNSDHTVLPALCIARGMHQILGDNAWNALKAAGPEELQDIIEGSLNKKFMMTRLKWEGTNDPRTMNFVSNWIDNASQARLRQFIFFGTGSNSLGKNSNLYLDLYRHYSAVKPLPRATICSRTILIPFDYASQQEFNQKLELALDDYSVASRSGLDFH